MPFSKLKNRKLFVAWLECWNFYVIQSLLQWLIALASKQYFNGEQFVFIKHHLELAKKCFFKKFSQNWENWDSLLICKARYSSGFENQCYISQNRTTRKGASCQRNIKTLSHVKKDGRLASANFLPQYKNFDQQTQSYNRNYNLKPSFQNFSTKINSTTDFYV